MVRFRVRDKRSPTDTRAFLLSMASQGQGGPPERRAIRTQDELKAYFSAHGYDYEKEFKNARHKDAVVGLLTVHLSTDMWSSLSVDFPVGGGSWIAYGNAVDGFTYVKGEPGHIVTSQYVDSFSYAIKNFNRCATDEKPDYRDLLSSFTSGMASIEAFVNKKLRPHLRFFTMSGKDALRKVHLETKIFEWLPKLCSNMTINRGASPWQDYEKLRHYRNEYHVHPKEKIYRVTVTEFCERLNLFRTGVARLLLDLHELTNAGAPPDLVKYAYWPEIEIVHEK